MPKPLLLYLIVIGSMICSCSSRKKVQDITVQQIVKSQTSWNGNALPAYGEGNPEVTMLRIRIPPGASLKPHKHLCINVGLLMKGELTVKTETNDSLRIYAGDPIVELVDTWHYGKNTGSIPAEIIVFYAGIEGQPITVTQEE